MAGDRGLAEQVRTRLERDGESVTVQPVQKLSSESASTDPLDEVQHRKPVRRHIKDFVCVFSIIFLLVGLYFTRTRDTVTPTVVAVLASAAFCALGYYAPRVLLPVWRGWMKFAMFLGIIVTTIIISLAWALVVIPTAMVLRIVRKRVMDMSYGLDVESYWEERDAKLNDYKLLERQF